MSVAIIISLYNRLELCTKLLFNLAEQIENLEAQDKVQVIIVNDGSTEEQLWLEPIKSLCAEYGFEYYYQQNGGESKAKNFGIGKVKTDYFTFIDCDDDILPEYLKNVLDEAAKGYQAVAFKWVYKHTKEEGPWHDRPLVNWNVWSWLYSTATFKLCKFDESRVMAADYFYLEEYMKANLNIHYADDKRTIIYNANNPNNLTNRFARGEVEVKKEV